MNTRTHTHLSHKHSLSAQTDSLLVFTHMDPLSHFHTYHPPTPCKTHTDSTYTHTYCPGHCITLYFPLINILYFFPFYNKNPQYHILYILYLCGPALYWSYIIFTKCKTLLVLFLWLHSLKYSTCLLHHFRHISKWQAWNFSISCWI